MKYIFWIHSCEALNEEIIVMIEPYGSQRQRWSQEGASFRHSQLLYLFPPQLKDYVLANAS